MTILIQSAAQHREALFQAKDTPSIVKAATAAIAFLEADFASSSRWDLTTKMLVADLHRASKGPLLTRLQKIVRQVATLTPCYRTSEFLLSRIREPLLTAYKTHRTGSHALRIDQDLVSGLYLEYNSLAEANKNKPESEVYRDACTVVNTIEMWQERRREGLITLRPSQEELALQDAEAALDELVHYPYLVDQLLSDKAALERFNRLVVRDHIPIRIFADWPEETEFLENAEGLHRSITGVGHTIAVGKSHFPEILLYGKPVRIRDLPGYREVLAGPRTITPYLGNEPDSRFRNLQGYCTLGCDAPKGNYFPYSHAVNQADLLYPNGYFYTAAKGLIHWNPRTWAEGTESGWKCIDLEQPDWIYKIPPITQKWIKIENAWDEGFRYEAHVEASEIGPQTAGTHGYYGLTLPVVPRQVNEQGEILVEVRTFGTFATPFEAGTRAINPFFGEILTPDQNHAEPSRQNASSGFRVTRTTMDQLIAFTKEERLRSLAEIAAHEAKLQAFTSRFVSLLGSIERAAYATLAVLSVPTSVYLGFAFATAIISTLTFALTLSATIAVATLTLALLKVRSTAPALEASFNLTTRNCTSALKRSANVAGISLPTTAQAASVTPWHLRALRRVLRPCSSSLLPHPYITKIFLAMQDDLHKCTQTTPHLYTKSTCAC